MRNALSCSHADCARLDRFETDPKTIRRVDPVKVWGDDMFEQSFECYQALTCGRATLEVWGRLQALCPLNKGTCCFVQGTLSKSKTMIEHVVIVVAVCVSEPT